MENKGTYKRKYYLHRMVKKQGFSLKLEQKHKTITVTSATVPDAKANKYVAELQKKFSYGVQILNPLIILIAAIVLLSGCSTSKHTSLPFAPQHKYGQYPVKRNKPVKYNRSYTNRQYSHQGN